MNFLALFFVLACLPSALIDFATGQWKNEPHLKIEDAYKWIYQATRGGEHAVPDKEMAREWLESEWKTLGQPKEDELLWQPLCETGEIGRLNLRPFRANGGKMEDLLEAFIKSSQDFKNDEANFLAAWNELGQRLKNKKRGNLRYHDWKRLDRKMRGKNYPAIHHSPEYEQQFHPAYRVLTREALPGNCRKCLSETYNSLSFLP